MITFPLSVFVFCICMFYDNRVNAAPVNKCDFSLTARSKCFVDKTMFIRDFLDAVSPRVSVVTAPTRWGKSAIVDMVKRFLGTQLDKGGKTVKPKGSENYRIFCDSPLNICKDTMFVDKHFGQYPVVHINYSPLSDTKNFASLLSNLRSVMADTYRQYEPLLEVPELWEDEEIYAINKQDFVDYINASKPLTQGLIKNGFRILTEILFRYFNQKVIVLLDDYDAYYNTVLYGNIIEIDKSIGFLAAINENLFRDNDNLEKALITGILTVKDVGSRNFNYFRFLGNHQFSQYYGFKEDEIDDLIQRIEKDVTKRTEIKQILRDTYNGYSVQDRDTKIFNTWSVIHFFLKDFRSDHFWMGTQYVQKSLGFLPQVQIHDIVHRLLESESVIEADISLFLDRDEVVAVEQAKRNSSVSSTDIPWIYSYLFDIGFLTPVEPHIAEAKMCKLKIPNEEVRQKLSSVIKTQ